MSQYKKLIKENYLPLSLIMAWVVVHTILFFPESEATHNFIFDPIHNKNTFGYSPLFLKDPLVKQNCLAALQDKVLLGYCKTTLGTL